jgi:hypothetical protein
MGKEISKQIVTNYEINKNRMACNGWYNLSALR